jgi:hypothetical protein
MIRAHRRYPVSPVALSGSALGPAKERHFTYAYLDAKKKYVCRKID